MIITDEEVLRRPNEDVKPEEVEGLIALLEKELAASPRNGVGLACPQIGINKRIAIVRLSPNHKADLINCRIEKQHDPFIFKGEGCLSIPDRNVDTMRYREIYVVDNLTFPHSFICQDMMSVVVQHELDHLAGILCVDRDVNKKSKKVRPNDPCPCGCGKKAKRCLHALDHQSQ